MLPTSTLTHLEGAVITGLASIRMGSVCSAWQLAPGCCGDQGASPSYTRNPGCEGYRGHPGFPSTVALNPRNYDSEAASGGMISWNRDSIQ